MTIPVPPEHAQLHEVLQQQAHDLHLQVREALRNQQHAFELEIAALREQVAGAQRQAAVAASDPPPEAAKTVKIPDPAAFTGDRHDLTRWIAQIKVKLSVNASSFPDNTSRIGYLFSRLAGDAAQQLLPYINNGSDAAALSSVEEFYQVLENAFGDPDRKTSAQNKLESLYQRNKEFAVHYAEFQRTAADCQYDDEALRSRLRRSLSQELRYALAMVPEREIATYTSLVARCQQLDNNLRAVAATAPRQSRPPAVAAPPQAPRQPPAAPKSSPVQPAPPGPEPMQLDSIGPRGPLSTEERLRRQRERLCLYCGQPGHFRGNCPNRPPGINSSAIDTLPPAVPSTAPPSEN